MQPYLIEAEEGPLRVGRKLDTEFEVELISPDTGTVLSLSVLGSRQSSANLKALAYAREDGDQSWRTKCILSNPIDREDALDRLDQSWRML